LKPLVSTLDLNPWFKLILAMEMGFHYLF